MSEDSPTATSTRPKCPACATPQSFLTPSCRACAHRYSPTEILAVAGALLESGMPRRSVRRQVAEAARGLTPRIMEASAESFDAGGQGQKLACLMAVQDFGDPRAIPPDLLANSFEACSPAVKAEIILCLIRSESTEANQVIESLKSEVEDPRLQPAFDDPFFRSEVLPLHVPTSGDDPVIETEDEADDGPEVEIEPEAPAVEKKQIEVVQVESEPPEQETPSEDETPPEDEEPTVVVQAVDDDVPIEPADEQTPDGESSKPPDLPRPSEVALTIPPPIPSTDGGADEASIARDRSTHTTQVPQELDFDRSDQQQESEGRSLGIYIVVLLLVLILGGVTAYVVHRYTGFADSLFGPAEPRESPVAGDPGPADELTKPLVEEPGSEIEQESVIESHILGFETSASSSHRKYPPSNISDGNPATVWQEDKKTRAQSQYLFLTFPENVTITRIGILGGYDDAEGKYGDMWKINNRLKKAEFEFSDGKVMFHEFDDLREMIFFELSPPHHTRNLKITVLDVYRGSWFYDNAIAEVEIWGFEDPTDHSAAD